MQQIFQDLQKGKTFRITAPAPVNLGPHQILIHTMMSLISIGTERMLVEFGQASYLEKARQQPEKVKQVLNKIKTDGLFSTIKAVQSKLRQPLALGYCQAGVVAQVGDEVKDFKAGDRVVSNGPHADVVLVTENLCARIPEHVADETAVFTVIAAIALQGIRLAQLSLGESVAVMGVGLIGLLTVQLLKAQGCRVLAIDFDDDKLTLAQTFGAEICRLSLNQDPVSAGLLFSHGHGVDAVMMTITTTSHDPIAQAATMSRKRGRIVLVGVTGLHLNRSDFYEKELSFQVSCSYGPGRYDPQYEQKGIDYPIGFVRWTEQRNFEACLELMKSGQIKTDALITHRFLFEEAEKAYELVTSHQKTLGIILQYTSDVTTRHVTQHVLRDDVRFDPQKPIVGFIGAGNFAHRVLIPAFKTAKAQLSTIVTSSGVSGVIHGQPAGFMKSSSDVESILSDPMTNTVVIVTRHDSHADLVIKALQVGKHVFVEKPLAIHRDELSRIESTYQNLTDKPLLMVGFNRRFAPHIQQMKRLLDGVIEPKSIIITVNAGHIPKNHWVHEKAVGGGRVIGEGCHFIDLLRYLIGHAITGVQMRYLGHGNMRCDDTVTIILSFADGSMGTIHYFANGSSKFPKERVEVFTAGRVLQLDNFCNMKGFGWPQFRSMRLWRQDKGYQTCVQAFLNAIEQGAQSPITMEELIEVSKVSIQIATTF